MNRRTFFLGAGALPAARTALGQPSSPSFPNLIRSPDRITAFAEDGPVELRRSGGLWAGRDIEVTAEARRASGRTELPVTLSAPKSGMTRLRLRWRGEVSPSWRFLADHWERSYGDLEWRGVVGDRIMPWYFVASTGRNTRGHGIKTGASAIASWQADAEGVTLCLDVHNGGSGVRLGGRRLQAATVVEYTGAGESTMSATRRLCKAMCDHPRLPSSPVYGSNNWYYTYGKNLSAEAFVRDADFMASLAPRGSNRPFLVLDMGYGAAGEGAGPVERTSTQFPDMVKLAGEVKRRGVRPGIWVRPLLTVASLPEALRLNGKQAGGGIQQPFFVLDPSVPEALERVAEGIRTAKQWGFELIKHDFSTFDITGRWGFQMGPDLTESGWSFHDQSRTTAEIIRGLYQTIREAAGDAQIIGCNTLGHLGAGLFEMQRIGDDTSGREWSRTRKMGVNTLAFRLPQHDTFFAVDADCVAVTKDVPWNLTKQWLELVSRSGTPLFVSADPAAIAEKERSALRMAFDRAARPNRGMEPEDWMQTTVPSRWSGAAGTVRYHWYEDE